MPGYGQWKYNEVPLTSKQLLALKTVYAELKSRSGSLRSRGIKNVGVLSPRECSFLGRPNPHTRCIASRDMILRGQKAIMIFTEPVPDNPRPKKIILGVFKDQATLAEVLNCGSLAAYKFKKRLAAGKVPRPCTFVPLHMEVCHCVQCGQRIFRPETMALYAFGKLMRCDTCKRSKSSMKEKSDRYCRRCATQFTPAARSSRICPWCLAEGL